jgi:hypothetical protein
MRSLHKVHNMNALVLLGGSFLSAVCISETTDRISIKFGIEGLH